jgi:transposase
MEDILDLYEEPFSNDYPVVCFDETPFQLVEELRAPIPTSPGNSQRYDYEYKRAGSVNIFGFLQPLGGWRHMKVTDRRTRKDFAECMKELVDEHFPSAEKIRLVLDNLNTHTPGSLYQTFAPEEARRILKKIDFHFTPKHASWLNMIEIEFSVLMSQCLKRRIGIDKKLKSEISAWSKERNERKATIVWGFTNTHAREKMKRSYLSK